jgi:hypothetical protein
LSWLITRLGETQVTKIWLFLFLPAPTFILVAAELQDEQTKTNYEKCFKNKTKINIFGGLGRCISKFLEAAAQFIVLKFLGATVASFLLPKHSCEANSCDLLNLIMRMRAVLTIEYPFV